MALIENDDDLVQQSELDAEEQKQQQNNNNNNVVYEAGRFSLWVIGCKQPSLAGRITRHAFKTSDITQRRCIRQG